MDRVSAVYLGKLVSKEHFRTFVYASDGSKKLVKSWDEYQRHMESGLWFSIKEDAMTRIVIEKPKRVKKASPSLTNELKEDVANDDFLPKGI